MTRSLAVVTVLGAVAVAVVAVEIGPDSTDRGAEVVGTTPSATGAGASAESLAGSRRPLWEARARIARRAHAAHEARAAWRRAQAARPAASTSVTAPPVPSATASVTTPASTPPTSSAPLTPPTTTPTTPTTTPTTTAAVGGSGAAPTGSSAGWRQVFVDDFTTDAPLGSFSSVYGSRWTGYEGLRDTSGAGTYSESRVVSVADGVLDMHLRTEGGQPLVAAPAPRVNGSWGGMKYGKYSVRFRSDPVAGYKMAWLLWPDTDDWSDGEIDFPEGNLDSTMYWANKRGSSPEFDKGETGVAIAGGWHTATTEWTPGGVTTYLDGRQVGHSDHSPQVPFHWVLQTETAYGKPPATSSGHVQVDWVAVWAWNG